MDKIAIPGKGKEQLPQVKGQPMAEGHQVRMPRAEWEVRRVLFLKGEGKGNAERIHDDRYQVDAVSVAKAASKLAGEQRYDFIVVDLDELDLRQVKKALGESKELGAEIPQIFGLTRNKEHEMLNDPERNEKIFVWNGGGVLNAVKMMKKLVEDQRKAHDQYSLVVLLVEDQPVLYSELLTFLQERYGNKALILLAESYEEAMKVVNEYEAKIIGLVADTHLPKKGRYCDRAGIMVAEVVKRWDREVPAVIISEDARKRGEVLEKGCHFLHVSEDLGIRLTDFLNVNAGFGRFVFRRPDRVSISNVETVPDFFRTIASIPTECLMYHACKDHFSTWLYLHGAREIADRIKKIQTAEYFGREEELRTEILAVYSELKHTVIEQRE